MSGLSPENEEYIRQQVRSIADPQFKALDVSANGSANVSVTPAVAQKPGFKIEPTLIFAVGVFLFAFGLLFYAPLRNALLPAPPSQRSSVQVYRNEGQVQNPQHQQVKPKPDINTRVQNLETRVWLLGVVNNENAEISKKFVGKYDPALAKKYVIFDREWRLTKMPEFLTMLDKERELMLRHIKPVDDDYQKLYQEYLQKLQELKDRDKTK